MMGSVGAPQPWPLSSSKTPLSPAPLSSSSTNNYNYDIRDCSQGYCSLYCPQWCNPPPYVDPSSISYINNDDHDSSSTLISPLMVALISILASAFLLVSYYIIVIKYCKRRGQNRGNQESDEELRLDQLISDSAAASTTGTTAGGGLDESFIRSITSFKYNKEDGLVEGTDCAVCLNEFNEEDKLRLMPNCQHAFHIPCIDTWLKTHSSCPLCRAGMIDGGGINNSAAVESTGSGNGNRQQDSGVSSSGSVRSNNNQSISAMQFQSRVREVTVVLVGDGENQGREVTVQLELPVSHGTFDGRGEGNDALGSQPRQQQQSPVTNEVTKEEIQR